MNIINYIDGLKHASTALTSLNTMSFGGEKAGKLTADSVTRLSLATSRLNEEQARLVLSTRGLTVEQQNQVLAENGLIATSDRISASIAHQNLQKTVLSQTEREQLLIDLQLMDADTKRLLTENACTEAELRAILAKRGYIGASQDEIVAAILGNNIRSQEIITWELLSASIKKAAVELWTFLTTNPVGWAILATGAIAGTVAIVNALTVSVEESREKLQDLKDECETIESDLSSMNDELQTTIDRMNELARKDKLTFAEKEEYNNLVETNNELQRSIDLLKLEQKLKNAEKNKTFVQTMQKDVTVQDERVHTGRMRKDDTAETILITETEFIQRKFEQLSEWQDKLKNATTETEINAFQEQIDRITDYLLKKNEEWKTDSEGMSYILDPSTEDEKAVNQWLDYINDFQDKMAIAMGGDNAKTNAFGRLVDNWAFDEVVQELQDLGKQGQVTADMLDDPKYDEFIQKLVELGIIDAANNIDDIVLAFNTLGKSLDGNADIIKQNTIPSVEDLTTAYSALSEALDEIYGKQDKLTEVFEKIASGAKLTAREVLELVEDFPDIMKYVTQDGDGYTITSDNMDILNGQLEGEFKKHTQSVLDEYEKHRAYLINKLNKLQYGSVNNADDAKTRGNQIQNTKDELVKIEELIVLYNGVVEDVSNIDKHQLILDGIDIQYDNAKSSVDDYNNSIKSINSAIDKMNKKQALTYDEMVELVEINPDLVDSFDKQEDGYYIAIDALEDLGEQSFDTRNDYIDNLIAVAEAERLATNIIEQEIKSRINSHADWLNYHVEVAKKLSDIFEEEQQRAEYIAKLETLKSDYTDDGKSSTGSSKDDPITTAFEKELKYLDYLRDMGMISAKEYYKQLYFLNEKYYSDNADYLEQYRDNEVKIRDGITDIEIRAIDRQIEALELLKEKREEEKELQELQVELEEKKLELLNKQSQKNVRYYDAEKREWIWTYNRNDVADAQKAVDEAQEALDEHLYQSNEDKKIEQLEQIKEILQGDEDNPNNSTQWSGKEGVTTQATARKVTAEEFYARLGLSQKVDTTALMRSIYAMGLQPNVQKIAESTHNQNISTVNRNIQGNQFTVNIDGSNLSTSELEKVVEDGFNEMFKDLVRQMSTSIR